MSFQFSTKLSDAMQLKALAVGVSFGVLSCATRGLILYFSTDGYAAKIHLASALILCALAGAVCVMIQVRDLKTPSLAVGIGGRLGTRAGAICGIVSGGLFTTAVTVSNLDNIASTQVWLTMFVSWATILPGVLSGFIGGAFGGEIMQSRVSANSPPHIPIKIPGIRLITIGLILACGVATLSPVTAMVLSFAGVTTDTLPKSSQSSQAFHYQPPQGIASAQWGQFQPDVTKVVQNVSSNTAISLSPDDRWLAYGERTASGSVINIFDLNTASIRSKIKVPSLPATCLSWSPDQKRLACVLGNADSTRRVWILDTVTSAGIELPLPLEGDVPAGDIHWWHDNELAFFPTDESPLVLKLKSLRLVPAAKSPVLRNATSDEKKLWLEGPRLPQAGRANWEFGIQPIIQSIHPPSRRKANGTWSVKSFTACAYINTQLLISKGFGALVVNEGDRVLCSSDGSKVIRVTNSQAIITYMKLVQQTGFQFSVTMPCTSDEVSDPSWKKSIESQNLCVFVCQPMTNPLTDNEIVGPDYARVRGVARLVSWNKHDAVFTLVSSTSPLSVDDVVANPHVWDSNSLQVLTDERFIEWWEFARLMDPTSSTKTTKGVPFTGLFALAPLGTAYLALKATHSVQPQSSTSRNPPRDDERIRSFILAHQANWNRGDAEATANDYNYVADFFDRGQLSRSQILAELTVDRIKWPTKTTTLVSDIQTRESQEELEVQYTIQFSRTNNEGQIQSGTADINLRLKSVEGRLQITSHKQQIRKPRNLGVDQD